MKHHKCSKVNLKSIFIYPFTMSFLLIILLLIGCSSNPYKLSTDETSYPITKVESDKSQEKSTAPIKTADAATTVEVQVLPFGTPDVQWQMTGYLERTSEDGKKITVLLYRNEDKEGGESKAYLEYNGKTAELGIINNIGPEDLFVYWQDVTSDNTEELIIRGETGASALTTRILRYDNEKAVWLMLLEENNLEFIELDENPGLEAVATSTGSIPPFVKIYNWNGKAFQGLDAAAATSNDYATLVDNYPIYWIIAGNIKGGKAADQHYYAYRSSTFSEYPEAFALQAVQKGKAFNNNFELIIGNNGTIDLNGDGKADAVNLNCEPGSNDFTLSVNDCTVKGTGNNLDGVMYVCDIDSSDKYKEIAITESGPSGDYATYFYFYDGENLNLMGTIQGTETCINMTGSGSFTTNTRGEIIQTWYFTDVYKLSSDHKLENVPQDSYDMNILVTVVKAMKLQMSRTDATVSLELQPGQIINMAECDNKNWCLIKTSDGKEGWFETEGFDTIKGTQLHVSDCFSGLSYAG